MPGRVDLHAHTSASDGDLAPTELVALARKAELDVLAITDHDTMAGIPAAREAAAANDLQLIAGVELTVRHPSGGFHLLGYFADGVPEQMRGALEQRATERLERARSIVALLDSLDAPLDWDDVLSRSRGVVGRPHIAEALVDAGHVPNRRAAFERYLGTHRRAFVPSPGPTPEQAIDLIRSSGGAAVLAHPYTLRLGRAKLRATVQSLATRGLVGIEVHRPDHSPDQVRALSETARHLSLLPCGGSDFHRIGDGARLGDSGDPPLPSGTVERLLSLATTPGTRS